MSKQKIKTPQEVVTFSQRIKHKTFCLVIYLDRADHLLTKKVIPLQKNKMVKIKQVFKPAIQCSATKILLVYKYGVNQTGKQTIKLNLQQTKKIITAANYLKIKIIDQIIITENSYYSLHEAVQTHETFKAS